MGKKIRQKIRIFELLPSEYSEIRILKNDRILQTLMLAQVKRPACTMYIPKHRLVTTYY